MVWVLSRKMGGRQSGGRYRRLQRSDLAGLRRSPALRRFAHNRTIPAPRFWTHGISNHDRRPESVHETLDSDDTVRFASRHGVDRKYLREREGRSAHGGQVTRPSPLTEYVWRTRR